MDTATTATISSRDSALLDVETESPVPQQGHSGACKITTPTISYSQILCREETNTARQQEDHEQEPSPATRTQSLKKRILDTTSQVRQSLMDMTKADHHRVVMQTTLNKGTAPKGLQADITPHIFKETELVRAEWNDAHREFSTRLTKILANHYARMVEDEMAKQARLQASILQMISQAKLFSHDREYIIRLWADETKPAEVEAKKLLSEDKAQQRKKANEPPRSRIDEPLRKRKRDAPTSSTSSGASTPKNSGELHQELKLMQEQYLQLKEQMRKLQRNPPKGDLAFKGSRGSYRGKRGQGHAARPKRGNTGD